MDARQKMERKIREKLAEIEELKRKIRDSETYLAAFQDALRLLPREGESEGDAIKPGTALAEAMNVLRKSGKPMHIMEILPAMGREATPENRASIGSTISAYVRRQEIFTRPGPNTFGLAEWGSGVQEGQSGPPDNFGLGS